MTLETSVPPSKLTSEMKKSLNEIQSCLLCPLCNNLMSDPSTLHCTHSFCLDCISNYEAWTCPVPGCGLPVSVRGSGYINVNPQLDTVVNSLNEIKKTLGNSKDYWWKSDAVLSQGSMTSQLSFLSPRKDTTVTFANEAEFVDFNNKISPQRDNTVTFADKVDIVSAMKNKEKKDCGDITRIGSGFNDSSFQESKLDRTPKRRKSNVNACTTTAATAPLSDDDVSDTTQVYVIDGILSISPHELNQSCRIPPNSPGMSPIVRQDSQQPILNDPLIDNFHDEETAQHLSSNTTSQPLDFTSEKNKNEMLGTSSNEEQSQMGSCERSAPRPSIVLLSDSKSLSSADQRCIRKLIKNDRLGILNVSSSDHDLDFTADFETEESREKFHSFLYRENIFQTDDGSIHSNAEVCYAICSNAEYQTCDGYMMARNFKYVLAVACGLSIVEIGFLRKASTSHGLHDPTSSRYLYVPGTVQIDQPTIRKRSRRNDSVLENFDVVGHVSSTIEFGGPKKSREHLISRWNYLSKDSYSNGLLKDYTVILYGDFDTYKEDENNDDSYTIGRVKMLLTLCGAEIQDMNQAIPGNLCDRKTVVMARNCPNADDVTHVSNLIKNDTVPIVSVQWLEDSITAFDVRNFESYQYSSE